MPIEDYHKKPISVLMSPADKMWKIFTMPFSARIAPLDTVKTWESKLRALALLDKNPWENGFVMDDNGGWVRDDHAYAVRYREALQFLNDSGKTPQELGWSYSNASGCYYPKHLRVDDVINQIWFPSKAGPLIVIDTPMSQASLQIDAPIEQESSSQSANLRARLKIEENKFQDIYMSRENADPSEWKRIKKYAYRYGVEWQVAINMSDNYYEDVHYKTSTIADLRRELALRKSPEKKQPSINEQLRHLEATELNNPLETASLAGSNYSSPIKSEINSPVKPTIEDFSEVKLVPDYLAQAPPSTDSENLEDIEEKPVFIDSKLPAQTRPFGNRWEEIHRERGAFINNPEQQVLNQPYVAKIQPKSNEELAQEQRLLLQQQRQQNIELEQQQQQKESRLEAEHKQRLLNIVEEQKRYEQERQIELQRYEQQRRADLMKHYNQREGALQAAHDQQLRDQEAAIALRRRRFDEELQRRKDEIDAGLGLTSPAGAAASSSVASPPLKPAASSSAFATPQFNFTGLNQPYEQGKPPYQAQRNRFEQRREPIRQTPQMRDYTRSPPRANLPPPQRAPVQRTFALRDYLRPEPPFYRREPPTRSAGFVVYGAQPYVPPPWDPFNIDPLPPGIPPRFDLNTGFPPMPLLGLAGSIKPPELIAPLTPSAVREFLQDYQTYLHELTKHSAGTRALTPISMVSCIHRDLREAMAMIKRLPSEAHLTDLDVEDYLLDYLRRKNYLPAPDAKALAKAQLYWDTKEKDPELQLAFYYVRFQRFLADNSLSNLEPKTICSLLRSALPKPMRKLIENSIDSGEHPELKTDYAAIHDFLLSSLQHQAHDRALRSLDVSSYKDKDAPSTPKRDNKIIARTPPLTSVLRPSLSTPQRITAAATPTRTAWLRPSTPGAAPSTASSAVSPARTPSSSRSSFSAKSASSPRNAGVKRAATSVGASKNPRLYEVASPSANRDRDSDRDRTRKVGFRAVNVEADDSVNESIEELDELNIAECAVSFVDENLDAIMSHSSASISNVDSITELLPVHLAQLQHRDARATELINRRTAQLVDGKQTLLINGVLAGYFKLDWGADESVISRHALNILTAEKVDYKSYSCRPCRVTLAFGNHEELINTAASVDVVLNTRGGPISLRNVTALIVEPPMEHVLLGRPLIRKLLPDLDQALAELAMRSHEPIALETQIPDVSLPKPKSGLLPAKKRGLLPVKKRGLLPRKSRGLIEVDVDAAVVTPADISELLGSNLEFDTSCDPTLPDSPEVGKDDEALVWTILEGKLQEALDNGMDVEEHQKLRQLIYRYRKCFAIKLGATGTAKVPPLKVRVKPGATPRRCAARRYSAHHAKQMNKFIDELLELGIIYPNNQATYASPMIPIPKPHQEHLPRLQKALRYIVDVRYPNSQCDLAVYPMPNFEALLEQLNGSQFYFVLDLFKGYWQFPLDELAQKLFSFMTDKGVYSSRVVIQGMGDAVPYFQSTMHYSFPKYYMTALLIWLDDLLGHAKTYAEFFEILTYVLEVCEALNIKLSAEKCVLFTRTAEWCGRVLSKDGYGYNPKKIQGLLDLQAPTTARDLYEFVTACGWMRTSIPAFAQLVHPLQEMINAGFVYAKSTSRKKTILTNVKLSALGWNEDHARAYEDCKRALASQVALAYPDPERALCLYTDASDLHWGGLITQVPFDSLSLPPAQQPHQLLACVSGSFQDSARHWPIIEKEAFPIIELISRFHHLFAHPAGFRIYSDHRNLMYLFDPFSFNPKLNKATEAKITRWRLAITGYLYTIEHIAGEENIWADLLSRWGRGPANSSPQEIKQFLAIEIAAILVSPDVPSPLRHQDFHFPGIDTVKQAQRDSSLTAPEEFTEDADGVFRDEKSRLWIPADADHLITRLILIAHAGAMGHRGIDPTLTRLQEHFKFTGMLEAVKKFIKSCLHCQANGGGNIMHRPWGNTLQGTKPNEVLHFDFLFVFGGYVLVLKDSFSKLLALFHSAAADSEAVVAALSWWTSQFGAPTTWVSDQGRHFTSKVVATYRQVWGIEHHLTLAYCPWSNGVIERPNRDILAILRKLLTEFQLPKEQWPKLLPIVQYAANHTPVASLGNYAPVTVFTGLPAGNALDTFTRAELPALSSRPISPEAYAPAVTKLAAYLSNIHVRAGVAAERKRESAREARRHLAEHADFTEGDFVLRAEDIERRVNKLCARWCGPFVIIQNLSNHIFKVRDLVNGVEDSVHAARLKFYSDADLNVSAELLDYIRYAQQGFEIEKILEYRWDRSHQIWELKIRWLGFPPDQDSWEPLSDIATDAKRTVIKFIKSNKVSVADRKKMLSSFEEGNVATS